MKPKQSIHRVRNRPKPTIRTERVVEPIFTPFLDQQADSSRALLTTLFGVRKED
jgi:hypothetical protein